MRSILLAGALLLPAAALHAALETPDCTRLAAWATDPSADEPVALTPELSIPHAATDAQLVPLFGVPLRDWSRNDFRALTKVVQQCRREAGKAKRRDEGRALLTGQKRLQQAGRAYKTAAKARENIERMIDRLAQERVTPELPETYARALAALDDEEADDGRRGAADSYANYMRQIAPNLLPDDRDALRARLMQRGQEVADEVAATLATARAERDAALAELAALTPTTDGYARLDALSRLPALNQLPSDETQAFRERVAERRRQLAHEQQRLIADQRRQREQAAAAALAAADAELAALEVSELADLGRLNGAYTRALSTVTRQPLGYTEKQRFQNGFQQRFNAERDRLLPRFEATLAALPASRDGLAQARTAVRDLTGMPDSSPLMRPYADAAQARALAISDDLERVACYQALERLDIDRDDADTPLWVGEPTTLGSFLCAASGRGHQIEDYSGGGLFSGTREVALRAGGATRTLRLQEAEIDGREMLIGYELVEQGRERPLDRPQWEGLAFDLSGLGQQAICERLMNRPRNELSMNDAQMLMGCVMKTAVDAMQRGVR